MRSLPTAKPLPDVLAKAERLPSLPAAAVEVLRLTRDERSTIDDLADAIARDPALSAKLLSFANSSLYGLGSEVTTLQRAAMVLGLKTVQLMSLSFSLATSLPRGRSGAGFDYDALWRRALARAVAGRALADSSGGAMHDEAFLCGILSGLGQLVLVECMPTDYAELIEHCGTSSPTIEDERERFGFDRSDVGMALLAEWSIPPIVHLAIGHAHAPDSLDEEAPEAVRRLTDLAHVAGFLADMLLDDDKGSALANLETEAFERLSIEPDEIASLVFAIEPDLHEAASMLELSPMESFEPEALLEEAREQLIALSLRTAGELRETRAALGALEHRALIRDEPSLVDADTGMPNDEAFHAFLDGETTARLAGGLDAPLGVLLLDVDRFTNVRAACGREAALEVLRLVATTLQRAVRGADFACFLGGDRFGVVMTDASAFGMRALAERLRLAVESRSLDVDGIDVSVTASLGGACLATATTVADGEALFDVAERQVARAKERGCNRAEVHSGMIRPAD